MDCNAPADILSQLVTWNWKFGCTWSAEDQYSAALRWREEFQTKVWNCSYDIKIGKASAKDMLALIDERDKNEQFLTTFESKKHSMQSEYEQSKRALWTELEQYYLLHRPESGSWPKVQSFEATNLQPHLGTNHEGVEMSTVPDSENSTTSTMEAETYEQQMDVSNRSWISDDASGNLGLLDPVA